LKKVPILESLLETSTLIEGVLPSAILVKVAILKRARILSKIEGEQSQEVFASCRKM